MNILCGIVAVSIVVAWIAILVIAFAIIIKDNFLDKE